MGCGSIAVWSDTPIPPFRSPGSLRHTREGPLGGRVALEEAANLVRAVAPQFAQPIPEKLEAQALQKLQQAAEVRGVLERLEPFVFE